MAISFERWVTTAARHRVRGALPTTPQVLAQGRRSRPVKQRSQMHVSSVFLGEGVAVGLPQGIDARVAVLLPNLTILVAATAVKPPFALLCHLSVP
jgi:hypothetical protein